MGYLKNFRELEVYRFSRRLSGEIFELIKDFPRKKVYSLTDQVKALQGHFIDIHIAEAWGKEI